MATNENIIINGNLTTCVVEENGNQWKGIAKRNPADRNNYSIGVELAKQRAYLNRANDKKENCKIRIELAEALIKALKKEINKTEKEIEGRQIRLEALCEITNE